MSSSRLPTERTRRRDGRAQRRWCRDRGDAAHGGDRGRTAATAARVPGRGGPGLAGTILDRYTLSKRVGSGAFGSVWMARDERLQRDVAVKILARELVSDGRFEREARAAARLSHPGIVTLYEAAVDDDGAYLVSELVDGATLDRLLADGSVSDRDILRIGLALCDALDHAHGHGVVHRDVKPSNVLVPAKRSDDRPPARGQAAKLTDFGVARVIDSDSLTLTGDVIGTLNYMSPEQAAGLEASEPADLYSLAVVLYEALTGINPLRSNGHGARLARARPAMLPPLRRQRRDLPASLGDAIDRALRPQARRPRHDLRPAIRPGALVAAGRRRAGRGDRLDAAPRAGGRRHRAAVLAPLPGDRGPGPGAARRRDPTCAPRGSRHGASAPAGLPPPRPTPIVCSGSSARWPRPARRAPRRGSAPMF